MLVRGSSIISDAAYRREAIAGLAFYNMETAQAIVRAAEQTGRPVLLQAGSGAFRHAGLTVLTALGVRVAEESHASIGLHLDHSRSLDEVTACLNAGYTSVMLDSAHLSFAENVSMTRAVVDRAHDVGAWVEGELGAIAGDEDVSTGAHAGLMTDPGQVADFVGDTRVDALAVAVGNVHGFTANPVYIDLDLLEAIRQQATVPLVLHGASGLSRETLLACLDHGVAKVNVNAELRRSFLAAVDRAIPSTSPTADLAGLLDAGRAAVTETAAGIISLLAREDGLRLRPRLEVDSAQDKT